MHFIAQFSTVFTILVLIIDILWCAFNKEICLNHLLLMECQSYHDKLDLVVVLPRECSITAPFQRSYPPRIKSLINAHQFLI